ncbi:hypothetical protein N7520_008701 [Penicillium odoratum]|uniref:uncharacterized protein n=1 Tax=Penicillium odoratum TaxID=1167516 RepID=UPI002546A625|nr:uncharacterized protein N7520_008701 [Penicillium odoratum]KAJ5751784.1 hypothetical protein N7520_008701 [Penicillium odoratum]
MNWTIPIFVFLTTNLWSLYGGIPYTTVQPSGSFLDRTIGSFQLASTIFTLGQTREHLMIQTMEDGNGNNVRLTMPVLQYLDPPVQSDQPPVTKADAVENQIELLINWLRSISSQTSIPNTQVPNKTPIPSISTGEYDFLAFALVFFGIIVLQTIALADFTRPQQDLQFEIRENIIKSRKEFHGFMTNTFPNIVGVIRGVSAEVQRGAQEELLYIHRSIQNLQDIPHAFSQLSYDLHEGIQAQFTEICTTLEKGIQKGFDEVTTDLIKLQTEFRQTWAQERATSVPYENMPGAGESSELDVFWREIWTEINNDFKLTVEGFNVNLYKLYDIVNAFQDQFQNLPTMMAVELTRAFNAEINKYEIDVKVENAGSAASAERLASRSNGSEDGQENQTFSGRVEEVETGEEEQESSTPQGSSSVGPEYEHSEFVATNEGQAGSQVDGAEEN